MARAGDGLLSADASEQLGEIDERLGRLDSTLKTRVEEAEQAVVQQAWQEELGKPSAATSVQRLVVLSGNQIAAVSGTSVVVATGAGVTPLSGGLVPAENARAFEFGTPNRDTVRPARRPRRRGFSGGLVTNQSRPGGATYARRSLRQMPGPSRSGWIAYPAAARLGKRLAQLLQQTLVKFTHDAIDGGQ